MSYINTDRDDVSNIGDENAARSRVHDSDSEFGGEQLQQVDGLTEGMSTMMKTAVNSASSNVATNIKQQIEKLKRHKARKKSAFTKARRAMLILLDEDLPSRREIRSQQQKMEDCQEVAMGIMEELIDMYLALGDQEGVIKINEELETLEKECTSTQNRAQEYLDSRAHEESSVSSENSGRRNISKMKQVQIEMSAKSKQLREVERPKEVDSESIQDPRLIMEREEELLKIIKMEEQEQRRREMENNLSINKNEQKAELKIKTDDKKVGKEGQELIGRDLWKQLRRVSIPVFDGNKATYESWKAAFTACIDKAPATPEYKLLQLRQHLTGEALKCIENLGHSAGAYEASKNRLERKFGGSRRRLALYIEQLESFRPIQHGNAKDVEEFSDLLDVAIINLRESRQYHELGTGSLYIKLQRKLPEIMLTNYHRWIFENHYLESVEVLRDFIVQEAEFQIIAAETLKGIATSTKKKRQNNGTFFSSEHKTSNYRQCKVCNGKHGVWSCEVFQRMDESGRWNAVKKDKLCFCCLGDDHFSKDCKRKRKCGIQYCNREHHKLLHFQKKDDSKKVNRDVSSGQDDPRSNLMQQQEKSGDQTMSAVSKSDLPVGLRTIPVILSNGKNKLVVNALLDDGSTKSYVNADVAFQLGTQGTVQRIQVGVLNGKLEALDVMPVELMVESLDGKIKQEISVFTVKQVTGGMKVTNWNEYKDKWNHTKGIQFPEPSSKKFIDILLGIDYPQFHTSFKEVKGKNGDPVARLTPLGWTCVGQPVTSTNQFTNLVKTFHIRRVEDLNNILRRFWEIENEGTSEQPVMTTDEKKAMKLVQDSIKCRDGQYEVGIPWKRDPVCLPDNYSMAIKRMMSTERKLLRDEKVAKEYNNIIEGYIEKGYVKVLEKDPNNETKKWYLPHFAVINPEKETTKTRIVFDASAAQNGTSLNDLIYQGPKLQRDLVKVLLRFRRYPVAIAGDISEMYLQVKIKEEDRSMFRFVWRYLDEQKSPVIHEFTRIMFGMNAAPFEVQYVVRHNAEKHQAEYPLAAETTLESTYMDDTMDSTETEDSAMRLYEELKGLWKLCGMKPHKWLSNSREVLKKIPIEERAKKIDINDNTLPSIKTLGIVWMAEEDVFTFLSNSVDDNFRFTKRNFLKKISTLFDPLGLLAPFTIRSKILMQETWSAGIDWDEKVPDTIRQKMTKWFQELQKLDNIKVNRCVRESKEKIETNISIHSYSDASEMAYGAVVYLVVQYQNGDVSSKLVVAKTKVAPLATVSIPRLELMAAILSLHLANTVAEVYKIDQMNINYWTDSMNVLWWVRNHSRKFKPFVANRVSEIQRLSTPAKWNYVKTKENPADLLSRGMSIEDVANNSLWWYGPEYLKNDNKVQLKTEIERSLEVHEEKSNQVVMMSNIIDTQTESLWRLNPKRYSSWERLTRICAWVMRFITNARRTIDEKIIGELLPAEVKDAEEWLIRGSQEECFTEEYKLLKQGKGISKNSKLICLQPTLDEYGIMRSNSRIVNAEFLSIDTRYPIILPRTSWVTKLIVKQYHVDGYHSTGTNHTLAALSSKYWIISAREVIREVEKDCVVCRRRKAKLATQVMAPLPNVRLKMSLRPFTNAAVDYAGPFITIQGRSIRRAKRYLCLFTCLNTRAIHLEMSFNMDTDSFLNAFSRMASRRGLPEKMFSDNGGNFVKADKELKDLMGQLDQEKIKQTTSNKGVQWSFNPPAAPHFGGVHEIMVKAAKKAIKNILGNADINDEELVTAFVGAEGLINSRPLTYQSSHPADDVPLTPNHFLYGQLGGTFAPDSIDESQFNLKKRWRRVQELIRHFWQRWMKEWIPSLNSRKKWNNEKDDFKVGDIVLVLSNDTPRGQWPLGRVTQIFVGSDGRVRVVKVQVGRNELTRSVHKLVPLEYDV